MLYDLNIAWSPSTTNDQLLRTLCLAASMGYETVALNHTRTLPIPANVASPFPSLAASDNGSPKLPHILHRTTLPLSDPSSSNHRIPSLASVYDLVAVRPLTADAFQNACLNLDVPLISLDLTQHFPFYFRPKPCMAAVSRGVRFEVCYSQVLAADARGRANFISNAASLFRATRGRGIILSSEANSALGLRAPADVVNLLSVWGLANEKGLEGLRSVPRSVVVNEGLKRSGFRGVIDVVKVAKSDDRERNEKAEDSENGAVSGGAKKTNPNQKRKPGEEGSQPLSKRQAKKMRIASRDADAKKK